MDQRLGGLWKCVGHAVAEALPKTRSACEGRGETHNAEFTNTLILNIPGMGLLIVDALNALIINTQTLILTLDILVVDILIHLY